MSSSATIRPAVPRGPLLLVIAAIAFSSAGFFVREAGVGVWAMVFWRNLFGGVALLALAVAGPAGSTRDLRSLGRWGWATILASAVATLCFLAAFAFTTVADIAIIYAAAPLVAALIAWVWQGEIAAPRTLVGAVLALAGVGVTLFGALGGGTLFGDGLALAMTVAMSLTTVLARRHPALPALPVAALATLLAALLVLPAGALAGASFAIDGRAALWLAGFGIVTMAIALPCYLEGVGSVPAAQAMLIGALEMPLAPLWVWLAFAGKPSRAALCGGGLVALAILGQLRFRKGSN